MSPQATDNISYTQPKQRNFCSIHSNTNIYVWLKSMAGIAKQQENDLMASNLNKQS